MGADYTLQVWSQFGYFGTRQATHSSRWEAVEAACNALSEQLFKQHAESGIWTKLENCWSDGLNQLTQLLEIQQVTLACLLVRFLTFWFGLQLVAVLECREHSEGDR